MKRSGRASVQPRDANSAFLKWGVPQLSSILIRFFHQPSSYWGTSIYRNPEKYSNIQHIRAKHVE